MSVLTRFSRRTDRVAVRRAPTMLEMLEERTFMSAAPAVLAAVDGPPKTETAVFANRVAKNGTTTMLPLTFTFVNGVSEVVGTFGDQVFRVPITLGSSPSSTADCPVLNFELAAIHLEEAGLEVDTSKICLDIAATPDSGNLLGEAVCAVAHLLEEGVPQDDIFPLLTRAQRTFLQAGLRDLLNGVLGRLTAPGAVVGAGRTAAPAAPGGACDTLNLSVAAADLDLLGLPVHVDNCDDGPVTLDITASPESGRSLGNLFCGVNRLLENPSNPNALANLLGRISTAIHGLL